MDSHGSTIQVGQPGYPFLLQNTYDPPKTLYYKGVLPDEGRVYLAVVGSRKMTPYGKAVLETLLPPIIHAGVGIISGLAYGIDTEAIRITLEENGYACGVIGSGMDASSFYPKQNLPLVNQMLLKNGTLFSEYPEGTPALPKHFAIRNRIIAGIAHGTLIIEAAKKSGSLITAEVAINEGREVFAVPHSIFQQGSFGTNELLKIGVHLITTATDILTRLGIAEQPKKTKQESSQSSDILTIVGNEPIHIDAIITHTNLTAQQASAILSELEIKGVVKNVGGMHYIRIHG